MASVRTDQGGNATGQGLHGHQIGAALTATGKHRNIRLLDVVRQLPVHDARQEKNISARNPIGL